MLIHAADAFNMPFFFCQGLKPSAGLAKMFQILNKKKGGNFQCAYNVSQNSGKV